MSKYHDHRSDCPFKFAPLDVCDCVEHNMLDHIEQLVAANKSLIKELKTCRMAQVVMENTVAEAVKMLDEQDRKYNRMTNDMIERHAAKLAKAVEGLRDMCAEFRGHDLPYGSKAYRKATAMLAEIEGSDAP